MAEHPHRTQGNKDSNKRESSQACSLTNCTHATTSTRNNSNPLHKHTNRRTNRTVQAARMKTRKRGAARQAMNYKATTQHCGWCRGASSQHSDTHTHTEEPWAPAGQPQQLPIQTHANTQAQDTQTHIHDAVTFTPQPRVCMHHHLVAHQRPPLLLLLLQKSAEYAPAAEPTAP